MGSSDSILSESSEKGDKCTEQPFLKISVIGGISVRVGTDKIIISNRKARALLAYLAIDKTKSHERERLAGLLWGEKSEKKARDSLRRALYDLREALNSPAHVVLMTDRRAVALDEGSFELDLAMVTSDVAAGKVPDMLLSQPRMGDTLFTGHEDLSPMYQEWIIVTRQLYTEQLLRLLEAGYEEATSSRKTRRRLAKAAVLIDPYHESACRAVMRLAAEDGEIGIAIQVYTELYNVLDTEMGMEPSAQTLELITQIKLGTLEIPADGAQNTKVRTSAIARTAFEPITGAPTVAVLPFRAIGPDLVPDYFAEGIVEDTVCKLSTLREPVVISNNSTRRIRNADLSLAAIGETLGARYIVSGTIRRFDKDLRLSVELAEVTSGKVLWADVYDTSEPHLFKTQDEIARSIASFLVPKLRDAELSYSRRQHPDDLSAYHLMLQGRELAFRLERDDFEAAGELIRRSTEIDPHFALSHAALADWYSIRLGQGWSNNPSTDLQMLEDLARKAIGLDSGIGRAVALLGHNQTIRLRKYEAAIALFDQALESSPNDAEALMWSSPTFSFLGDCDEAINRAERAIALSPQDPYLFRYEHFLAIGHYTAGDYENALYWGERSLDRNPHYTSNLRSTIAALVGMEHLTEAKELAAQMAELQPEFRVSSLIADHPFRDASMRECYGKHLLAAGLTM